jgi:hypothetical protein
MFYFPFCIFSIHSVITRATASQSELVFTRALSILMGVNFGTNIFVKKRIGEFRLRPGGMLRKTRAKQWDHHPETNRNEPFLPLAENTKEALQVLYNEIGVIHTIRFVNQFATGYGDYAEECETLFTDMTLNGFTESCRDRFCHKWILLWERYNWENWHNCP